MKVAVGLILAHGFPVPTPFVISWTRVLQTILTGLGNELLPPELKLTEMNVIYVQDFPIDHARNKAVRLFLDDPARPDYDYLLFLDADMTHPPETVHRLVRHGLDVVTGRYVMRKPPFFSVAMRKIGPLQTDYQSIEKFGPVPSGLVPIDAGGAGVLLMSRRVLLDIRARVGDDWFRYQDGPDGLRSRSEDMWFYEQARAAGYQPWLDADLWCEHERRELVGPRDHAPFAAAFRHAVNDEVSA